MRSANRRLAGLLLLVVILLVAAGGVAQAQDRSGYWQRYDVDINIMPSGDFRVEETQELVFTSGTFRFGQREIPLNKTDGISDITVSEEGGPDYVLSSSGEPYTYSVRQEGNSVYIRYNFPPSSDTRRTIVIGYRVSGGLRYYPEDGVDQLYWTAIPDGNPFPTRTSVISVHLPEGAAFTNYDVYGATAEATFEPGQSDIELPINGPIQPGQAVEVVAEWNHGVVAGTAPAWQQQADAEALVKAREEEWRNRWGPVFTLGFASLGGLLAIGGSLGLYLFWYRKGRDAPVGLVADYLPEAPSDLPAPVAGTLIDESADIEDILATVLDLARQGYIEIEEQRKPGFAGIGSSTDFVYRKTGKTGTLRSYEQTVMDKMFGKKRTEVELSDLKNKFYDVIPTVRQQLYEEVVKEGYFIEPPEKTRNRYSAMGIAALVLGG